ncbi:MAG: hypothetical protein JST86_07175 [Bacteroidetes bacterium]|nr:hypothetical protein [Bacteroidota bacterium]
MKKISVFVLVIMLTCKAYAQAPATELITTMRMGPFKINMNNTEIEKASGLTIPALTAEYMDTVKVNYKGAEYTLVFEHEYDEDSKKPVIWKLYAVSSTSTTLKTKSQVGISSTKAAILQAYDKFDMNIYNDYQYKEKGNAKDKIQYINLQDFEAGTMISFTTENRIVTKIEVTIYEGD